ncbi:MAG: MerR family DNA-binding transcriptional regulator [Polaromonas sp.]|uniref:MerR family DNA-binding transcriptional regulator n=1 Tax=Polaromonas sp. TaxID=1869339 RepID=UPI0040369125
MQISELAAQTGVSVHALRHYEKLGLLRPARRPSGYRDYTDAMRREVVFIAMSRRIGFSLKAIAAQLPAYRSGQLSFDDMLAAMQTRVADIDVQIAGLKTQRRAVLDHIAWMKKRQREHLARKAAHARAPRKPAWPVVTPSRKRTAT